ncbi:hypothetical protein [Jiella marina]|uniref:hypothetical protein n=1 Tax=Jiella sp. LLJ827 TaxID=2917712 RepID=UPI0021009F0F|nr:hypothetical protein [Jiella sp. LLJ827]MCQ0987675.1 hypothetical protein [Jiella sp. LLJ827]
MLLPAEIVITAFEKRRGALGVDVMEHRFLRLSAPVLLLVGALAGCGVKNAPVAPQSGQTPSAIAGDETQSVQVSPFGGGQDEADVDLRARRLTDNSTNVTVSAAEVTRNPKAEENRFFLDWLLN